MVCQCMDSFAGKKVTFLLMVSSLLLKDICVGPFLYIC